MEAGAFWSSTARDGNAMVTLIASAIHAPITNQGQRTTNRPIHPKKRPPSMSSALASGAIFAGGRVRATRPS
jgi:hypothetical protein